jgi:hypothetical protein
MKNILLTLIFLSPLAFAESKVLELTCDGPYPFFLIYNFETKKGEVIFSPTLEEIGSYYVHPQIELVAKNTTIRNLSSKGDYYRFNLKRKLSPDKQNIFINRKNLHFEYRSGSGFSFGICRKGIHELPENQI